MIKNDTWNDKKMKMIKYMIKNDECNDNQNDKKMKKLF